MKSKDLSQVSPFMVMFRWKKQQRCMNHIHAHNAEIRRPDVPTDTQPH